MASASTALPKAIDDPAKRRPMPSPGRLVWRRFRHHRMAMWGAVLLLLLLAYVTAGMLVFGEQDANRVRLEERLQAPSSLHPWGTDAVGRDVLARTVYGGQISLLIGVASVVVMLVVGVTIGAVSGYYGGWIDSLLMRFTEAMLNIPQLFLLIIAAKYLGDKVPNFQVAGREFSGSVVVIITIIGLDSWMYLSRIVRSQFLALKENEFVTAARCVGTPNKRIILRHILPNSVAPIIVSATLGVANAILSEAYISFLGLGVRQPTATWGNMLEDATRYLDSAPWIWFFPGLLILITVLAINFVGDGLRDALDPRTVMD
jgi:peptide/nickel transport system permease protein